MHMKFLRKQTVGTKKQWEDAEQRFPSCSRVGGLSLEVSWTVSRTVSYPGNRLREWISGAVITHERQLGGVSMLINLTAVVISLCISNHHVYTLKTRRFYSK